MIQKVIVSGILLLLIDSIYLYSVSKYFNNQIKMIQGSNIKLELLSTLLSYFFLIIGLNHFVIQRNGSILDAFLLGLVIYMVYECTNKAIILKWKWSTVLLDGVWGGILFALTTYGTYKICKYLK
jgi:uncharacterized membrane protein